MVRINAIFSEEMLKELDSIGRNAKKSRSLLIREAVEKFIAEYHRQLEEDRRKERIKRAIEIQNRLRDISGKWDGVSELRKWRAMSK